MLRPDYLKAGDRIRIVSPAGRVTKEKILPAVELFQQSGFEVLPGKHVFNRHFRFAGTDEQRLHDLQHALDDPDCKAVICSRGGYGTIRIIEKLDFTAFRKNPKWLVGFSDITLLHALFQKKGYCSIHGAMPAFYLKEAQPTESFNSLLKVLKGEELTIQVPVHALNRAGKAKGQLIGGNLSIISSLSGTPLEPKTDGKILFIEDVSEYLYHLDRMMYTLKLSGKLKKLKGLIVGGFTDMKDNDCPFGQSIEEIITNAVSEYDYPVCFSFPAGHLNQNLPLVFGNNYSFLVEAKKVDIKMNINLKDS